MKWCATIGGLVMCGMVLAGRPGAARADDPITQLNSWYYPGAAAEADWREWDGWTVTPGATYYAVGGDEGRFRQDRFVDDDLSGGVERLSYRDDQLEVNIRAHAEYAYQAQIQYEKPDAYRLWIDYNRHRKYYDGSNEPWNPARWGLPAGYADWPDEDLYADRTDLTVEGTLLLPDLPHVTVGWHYWERTGEEVLLWGGLANNPGLPGIQRARSIPAINEVDGTSHTIYVEVPFTLADKYNFKIRQEYEKYQDNQVSSAPAFTNGAFQEMLTHDDDLEWQEFRTRVDFNSFLTDNIYASAAFYHSDLENDSDRDVTRPGPAPSGGRSFQFVASDVFVDRQLDVMTLGLVFLNIAKDAQLSTDVRFEYSDTDGLHQGLETPFFGALGPVKNQSSTEEFRVAENVRFVSKAHENTTVTLEGTWEQRYLDLREIFGGSFARKADIQVCNQEYSATVVRRLRPDLKVTGRYRFSDNNEDYDEDFDIDPASYPGYLGDRDQQVHEVMTKVDWHFLPAWTFTGKYEFEADSIEFDRQTQPGQDLDAHRLSATVFGTPVPKLVCTGMLMAETYRVDTPTVTLSGVNQWAGGTRPWDTEYDAYVGYLSCHYVFNDKWAGNCAYQHTELNGSDVNNGLDEVWVGMDYTIAEDRILRARYEYVDFRDQLGDGFDDYTGHGISLALAFRF